MSPGPSGTYTRRVVDNELDALLPHLPAIAIEGAKGVGKTATALQRATTVHRLDDAAERELVVADPSRLTSGVPPVLVDEWQRVPATWDVIRRAVDDGADPGRYLLTGSATPSDGPSHSGAGRIVTVRLRPLALAERSIESPTVSLAHLLRGERPSVEGRSGVGLDQYVDEIVRSGFPGIRHLTDRPLRAQLDSYLDRVIDRDVEEAGMNVRRLTTLRRWMTAYAAATATTASYESIRDAATGGEGDKPAKSTTAPYRDALERVWVVEPLPAWLPTRSHLTRLASPPKHHLVDPALATRLLGMDARSLLQPRQAGIPLPRDGFVLGGLFESLVTQSVRVYAQAAEARAFHLRTRGGVHEVDLIVQRAGQSVVAIEVKLGRTVDDRDVRHLRWLSDQLGADMLDAVVVTTGSEAYRRDDGIAVVPAALLGP